MNLRKAFMSVGIFGALLFIAAVPTYYGSLNVPTGGTITNPNFTSGNCVQTTTGGLFTAAPCPTSAPGVTAVTGSGNIAVSTGPTPNVTITNAPTFTGAVGGASFLASASGSFNFVSGAGTNGTGYFFGTAACGSASKQCLAGDDSGPYLSFDDSDAAIVVGAGGTTELADAVTVDSLSPSKYVCTDAAKNLTSSCPATPAPPPQVESGTASSVAFDGSAGTTITFGTAFGSAPNINGSVVYAGATPPASPAHLSVQFDDCGTTSCVVYVYGGAASSTGSVSWIATK